MPLPATILRRRHKSVELANNRQHLQDIDRRRYKFSRIFNERLQGERIVNDPRWRWNIRRVASAFNNTFGDVRFTSSRDELDLLQYLSQLRDPLITRLKDIWRSSPYGGVAFNLEVSMKYYASDDPTTTSEKLLTSDYYPVFTARDILLSVESACEDIIMENEYYQSGRSNWVIDSIYWGLLKYQLVAPSRSAIGGGRFSKMYGKRGKSFIQIPEWLQNKKCTINFANKDNKCFKYAMECAFMHKMNGKMHSKAFRTAQYEGKNTFNYGDLEFPIHTLDVEKFEALNTSVHNLALHVYTIGDQPNEIGVLYSSTNSSDDAWHVELLIITENGKEDIGQINTHWLYVSNFSALLTSPKVNTNSKRRVFCHRCTLDFINDEHLKEHMTHCKKNEVGSADMPLDYEKWKYFKDHNKMLVTDFVIYADFEAFNAVLDHDKEETKTEESRLTEHVGASFCFRTVCRSKPEYNNTVIFSYDKDDFEDKFLVGRKFIELLEVERDRVQELFKNEFSYPLDQTTLPSVVNTKCVVCSLDMKNGHMPHWEYKNFRQKADFKDENEFFTRHRNLKRRPLPEHFRSVLLKENRAPIPVWDSKKQYHNFQGYAHYACGRYRPGQNEFKLKIPVVFHNLSNYDAHFILKALDPSCENKSFRFSGIPTTGDKFMSFQFRGLKFIDSFRFMGASLDSLSQNLLKTGKESFANFNHFFHSKSVEIQEILLQKGEFPYEYFNHPKVFKETSLPPIECFHSKLRDKDISHEDYAKAKKVWNLTECRTFQDYHDLYLLVDVMLLADVFENFRTLCLQQDRLDPVNYVSLPGYAMDSAFIFAGTKTDGVREYPFNVELFDNTQVDMYLFIEESIRGGVSMTPGRYSKANHEFLSDYDTTKEKQWLFYLDANNLYGYAMNQSLPFCDYKWVKPTDVDLMSLQNDSRFGHIFEVDGYFPDSIHDHLSDFPPAPVKQAVTEDMISPFSRAMNERYENMHDSSSEKLLCTLEPRKNYICYYRTLQLYCQLGFVITKVHRVLQFCQSTWLSDYINFNTDQRAKSKNAFEKDFYKLKNNSVYGKFIQNNRKFKEVSVWDNNPDKYTWSPFMKGREIINDKFVLEYRKPKRINLSSPVGIGSVILDHSKYLMYSFYYNVMKSKFNTGLRLIFTDTDSLCMEIKGENPMIKMRDDGTLDEWFDLDEYPNNSEYYGFNMKNNKNKKVIGKFKDEMVKDGGGVYITEAVALRSKMYSCLQSDGINKKTAKGVSYAAKQRLTHNKYLQCLLQDPSFTIEKDTMVSFRSTNNIIHTITMEKTTLSPCDSKVYLIDSFTSRPFGYYNLPSNNNNAQSSS